MVYDNCTILYFYDAILFFFINLFHQLIFFLHFFHMLILELKSVHKNLFKFLSGYMKRKKLHSL